MEGCTLQSLEIRVEQKRNRVKTERKKEKKSNAASTGNRTRDPSITDQMSILTNQVHLKIQYSLDTDLTKSAHSQTTRYTDCSTRNKMSCKTLIL